MASGAGVDCSGGAESRDREVSEGEKKRKEKRETEKPKTRWDQMGLVYVLGTDGDGDRTDSSGAQTDGDGALSRPRAAALCRPPRRRRDRARDGGDGRRAHRSLPPGGSPDRSWAPGASRAAAHRAEPSARHPRRVALRGPWAPRRGRLARRGRALVALYYHRTSTRRGATATTTSSPSASWPWRSGSRTAPIASAKVGDYPDGSPRLHSPDLAILNGERPIAIEVELTPKSPQAPGGDHPRLAAGELGRGGPLPLRARG